MKVKDCMCDDVCCAKPETTVSDVAKLMSKKSCRFNTYL